MPANFGMQQSQNHNHQLQQMRNSYNGPPNGPGPGSHFGPNNGPPSNAQMMGAASANMSNMAQRYQNFQRFMPPMRPMMPNVKVNRI